MDILKLLGKHIRKIRNQRGLTQEKLAQKSGMYSPYIGEIERGEKRWKATIKKRLSIQKKVVAPLFGDYHHSKIYPVI